MMRWMTIALSLLLVAGCATAPAGPEAGTAPEEGDKNAATGETKKPDAKTADEKKPDATKPVVAMSARDLPRTLALLPLVPPADDKENAAKVLGNMIYGAVSTTPYDVLKPQVVEERLARAGIADPKAAAAKSPAELGKILGVDGIVYGEMTHYDRLYLAVYSQVAAGAHIKVVDARNGQALFERKEVSRSHEGSLPTNPISAAITVIQTALNLREIQLIKACDDLVRGLTKGLPVPPVQNARRPPALTNVVADGTGRMLKTGDVVTVIAQGQQGVIGSFDVVPIGKNVPMEETGKGVFVGRYTVKPGDNTKEAYIVARLTDSFGRVNEREDVLGRFVVDTEPPAIPAAIKVGLKDKAVQVTWAMNTESDLAGYRVYRSDAPLTGFAPVATVEVASFKDEVAGTRYYRVSALDRAGNESAPSASVGLPVLGSALTGSVTQESYLVAANSPYTVEGTLTVEEGATLHVLPGVTVRFAPGADGIVVKNGFLQAIGTDKQRITFVSASERPAPGDFKTAVQIQAKDGQTSVLDYVAVEHAGVAVKVSSGGIEVLHTTIAGNRQGGIEIAETGVVKLSQSRIASHKSGAGVTVQGFGRATLRGNGITDNAWAVVNYSGNQVDARENWWGSAKPDDSLFVGDIDRQAQMDQAPAEVK